MCTSLFGAIFPLFGVRDGRGRRPVPLADIYANELFIVNAALQALKIITN